MTGSKTGSNTGAMVAPLSGLAQVVAGEPQLRGVVKHLGEPELHMTGNDRVRPHLIAALAAKAPVLAVTATGREAEDLTSELRSVLGAKVAMFPSWETLPHERLSPAVDTVATRRAVLSGMRAGTVTVVVAAVRSLVQPVLDDGAEAIRLAVDEEVPDLPEKLERHGYSRVDMVGRRGQFAVRGGIVDVFPATADNPVRVELWGDEVAEMRVFSVGDQRTISEVEAGDAAGVVEVHACRAASPAASPPAPNTPNPGASPSTRASATVAWCSRAPTAGR